MPAPPDLRQLVVGDRVQGMLRVVERLLVSAKSLWQLERRRGVSGEQRLGRQRHRRG